jgi:hypothetical protein
MTLVASQERLVRKGERRDRVDVCSSEDESREVLKRQKKGVEKERGREKVTTRAS